MISGLSRKFSRKSFFSVNQINTKFVNDPEFTDMNLHLQSEKIYLEGDNLIKYGEYTNNNQKKIYAKKYYNIGSDYTFTNTIEILGGSKKTSRPEIIGSLLREDQETALQKIFGKDFRPPQVVGLSFFNIPENFTEDYLWTFKIDGHNSYIKVQDHILQAEYYKDVFYVFDILDISGNLPERLAFIKKNIKPGKYIKIKQFYNINSDKPVLETLKNLLKEKAKGLETDGIVFSSINESYQKTQHLKLKPKKFLTNDYKYIWNDNKQLYFLECRGTKFNYQDSLAQHYELDRTTNSSLFNFHIPYLVNNNYSYICNPSKSLEHTPDNLKQALKKGLLNNKIVETAYTDEMIPYPIRVREDKSWPNGFTTCLTNYENRLNPIEDIQDPGYFQINDHSEKYENFRKIGNQFRKDLLEKAIKISPIKNKIILDFGSGRGVNLHIILPAVKKYLSLEPDRIVWVEQYSRMRDICKNKRIKMPNCIIFDYSSLFTILKHNPKIDLFISNYSIHYMLGNLQDINTLKQIFQSCEHFAFLYYSGEKIFALLEKKNPFKNEKYFIKKLYKESVLENYGQRIEILLPTISENIYTEFLVNTKFLEKLTQKKLKSGTALKDLEGLDNLDKVYLSLINYLVG